MALIDKIDKLYNQHIDYSVYDINNRDYLEPVKVNNMFHYTVVNIKKPQYYDANTMNTSEYEFPVADYQVPVPVTDYEMASSTHHYDDLNQTYYMTNKPIYGFATNNIIVKNEETLYSIATSETNAEDNMNYDNFNDINDVNFKSGYIDLDNKH